MHIRIFNICLLVGWLLVLVGSCIVNVGLGLAVSGLLMILLTLVSVRLAGGVYAPAAPQKGS